MDHMNDRTNRSQIQDLMDEHGLSEEDASFAVRLGTGRTKGDLKRYPWPLPEEVSARWSSLLVEHLGFTPDEAERYLEGDQTAIEAVAARRVANDVNAAANPDSLTPISVLSSD